MMTSALLASARAERSPLTAWFWTMPMPLTTPLRLNFKRSPTGGATSLSPSMLLRSIVVGLANCSGPVMLGVVSGGTGVAAATGLGAAARLAAAAALAAVGGHAAAAEERACGQVARRSAIALAAAGGHAAAGAVPAGACAHARLPVLIRKIKPSDETKPRIRCAFILTSPPPTTKPPSRSEPFLRGTKRRTEQTPNCALRARFIVANRHSRRRFQARCFSGSGDCSSSALQKAELGNAAQFWKSSRGRSSKPDAIAIALKHGSTRRPECPLSGHSHSHQSLDEGVM